MFVLLVNSRNNDGFKFVVMNKFMFFTNFIVSTNKTFNQKTNSKILEQTCY